MNARDFGDGEGLRREVAARLSRVQASPDERLAVRPGRWIIRRHWLAPDVPSA